MSDEIIKILDDLGQRFGIAIDWSSENIMPYLNDLMSRFITYEIASSIIHLIVYTVCGIGMVIAITKLIKYQREYNRAHEDRYAIIWPAFVSAGCMFGVLFCVVGAVSQIDNLIMCNTIPEQVIINYINALVVE